MRKYFTYTKERLKANLEDMLHMNGSKEYLTEQFIDLMVYEMIFDLGAKLPELRPVIMKKYPQGVEGMDDMMEWSWFFEDHPNATEEECEAFAKTLIKENECNKDQPQSK